MHVVREAVALLLLVAILAACQAIGPLAPKNPTEIGLRSGDLPSTLQRCPGSGDLTSYLRTARTEGGSAWDELQTTWRTLQHEGAQQAAVAVYASDRAACTMRLGTGPGSSASSLVVRYHDDRAALAAYQRGMLGFPTPGQDEQVPGLQQGAATGLSQESWLLEQNAAGRSVFVACWQRGSYTGFFLAVDLDPLHARQAVTSIAARMP
ncbi:MAG TPA: hypothetical protein VKY90_14555 [Candidatus Dormibacteraeota bacterium]|nr:hypothetical protein [Candidatus Dormibacteraeota bacterium]